MSEELKRTIVEELAKQRHRSDIVTAVCEQTGMDWPQAEQLVSQVEKERAHTIAARQTPILVFLSACTAVGGVLMVAYTTYELAPLLQGSAVQVVLVLVAAINGPLLFGLVGLGMIVGGAIGMYRTSQRFFKT